jgi:hypothetical protein
LYLEEREQGAEFEEYHGERLALQLVEFDSKAMDFRVIPSLIFAVSLHSGQLTIIFLHFE